MSYFYVIEHSNSGKLYAGVRIADKSNPQELLKVGGYCTSSKLVKSIIKDEGIESFNIRYIREFKTKEDAVDWETRFLEKVDAANNEKFLNGHNNTGINYKHCKDVMYMMYGVEYALQADMVREKIHSTNLKRYGSKSPLSNNDIRAKSKVTLVEKYGDAPYSSDIIRNKYKQTCIDKYGVDNTFKSDEVRAKITATMFDKYGSNSPIQNVLIKENITKTMIERYGVEHALQSEEFRQKFKDTCIEKFGTDHHFKNDEIKQKISDSVRSKYGVDCITQSDLFKQKAKQKCLEKYGVTHHSKVRKQCPYCNHETSANYLPRHIKKHHPEMPHK